MIGIFRKWFEKVWENIVIMGNSTVSITISFPFTENPRKQ